MSTTRKSQRVKVKLVSVTLPLNLRQNVLVVIIPQRSAEFVVVHVWLSFFVSPPLGHGIRVDEMEFSATGFGRFVAPCDAVSVSTLAGIGQHLEQKLPQLYLARRCIGTRKEVGVGLLIDFLMWF